MYYSVDRSKPRRRSTTMRPRSQHLLNYFLSILMLVFHCEFLVYYLVQMSCDFPPLDPALADKSIPADNVEPLKVMVLADTHLLGSKKGHWFDKLRREWQMYRAFQSAIKLHRPDAVFVLGDLTDEGLHCSKEEFEYYVKRFHSLFAVPQDTQMYVTVGNHDIGFHYWITPYLNQRFESAFNASAVQFITIRDNHFILLNSMAFEGDGCFLCHTAEEKLTKIGNILRCSKGVEYGSCRHVKKLEKFSKPILMQHFPLYRPSDMDCTEPDSAPMPEKEQPFRENWDCLGEKISEHLLIQLRPRLALSGHTHHGCVRPLGTGDGYEVTVPSFSWRNKNNPSYSLLSITPNNHAVYRCSMPHEQSVINMYLLGACAIFILIVYNMAHGTTKQRKRKRH